MNKTELRTIHSALVTMQRPNYKLAAATLMQAAREAAKLEPQIQALDAALNTARRESEIKAHEIQARYAAEIEQLKAATQAECDKLCAETATLEPFTLPEADIAAAITATPELLDVIKPLLPYIVKAES